MKELEKYWRFMKKAEHRVLEGKVGIKQVYDEMADLWITDYPKKIRKDAVYTHSASNLRLV